jgi:hypothetical protein
LKRPAVVCGFGILVKEPVGIMRQTTVQDGFFDFWRALVTGENWFFEYSENHQSRFHYITQTLPTSSVFLNQREPPTQVDIQY